MVSLSPTSSFVLSLFLFTTLSAQLCVGLQCFLDTDGIKRPDNDDEKVDTERFKKFNCSLHGGTVEKVRMNLFRGNQMNNT